MEKQKNKMMKLVPVMLCFFAMGFVDLVGIASNYAKDDLGLSDTMANILPSMVFVWFLIFSVPTGLLMNKIGRKRTVLLSLLITIVSLALPILGNNFYIMIIAFSLLGIGNALMQTSLKNRIPHEWDVLVIIFAQINYICQLAVEYPPFRSGRVDAGRQGYDLVTS